MSQNESVVRVLRIIEYLAGQDKWVGVRTLARDLGLSSTTAHRFLGVLKDLGYVKQDAQQARYALTLKVAWVASQVLARTELCSVARPWMERLTALTNETTHLAVIENEQVVHADKVDNRQAMQMRGQAGKPVQMHCTALGKVVLAFLPDDQREAMLGHLHLSARTEHTIVDPDVLRQQLRQVRAQGYAVDDEENEIGIRCVGAPLFDHTGAVVGAVSISGWTITCTSERVPQLAAELRETCLGISRELGYAAPEAHQQCAGGGQCEKEVSREAGEVVAREADGESCQAGRTGRPPVQSESPQLREERT